MRLFAVIMAEQRAEKQLSFSSPSLPFQKGKPARQPPSEDEDEEEKSDDNDTMMVSSLLNFIHCNPAIFRVFYFLFFFFPCDGRAQRTFLWQSITKNGGKTPTPT